MPTYDFRCPECDGVQEAVMPISSLDSHQEICDHCRVVMERIITGGRGFFNRSPFPSEAFEHADFSPRAFRDKVELKDHCEAVGLRSRLLEDGDVP